MSEFFYFFLIFEKNFKIVSRKNSEFLLFFSSFPGSLILIFFLIFEKKNSKLFQGKILIVYWGFFSSFPGFLIFPDIFCYFFPDFFMIFRIFSIFFSLFFCQTFHIKILMRHFRWIFKECENVEKLGFGELCCKKYSHLLWARLGVVGV